MWKLREVNPHRGHPCCKASVKCAGSPQLLISCQPESHDSRVKQEVSSQWVQERFRVLNIVLRIITVLIFGHIEVCANLLFYVTQRFWQYWELKYISFTLHYVLKQTVWIWVCTRQGLQKLLSGPSQTCNSDHPASASQIVGVIGRDTYTMLDL